MAPAWPASSLETWALIAFVTWIALVVGVGRLGTTGRIVVALLSWLIARGAMAWAPAVVHRIR